MGCKNFVALPPFDTFFDTVYLQINTTQVKYCVAKTVLGSEFDCAEFQIQMSCSNNQITILRLKMIKKLVYTVA